MTDTPQPDLTAIRERLEKATKGPWALERSICGGGGWHWARVMGGDAMRGFESVEDAGWFHEDDAEFIAHAPEDIAALLAMVSTLTAERERIMARLSEAIASGHSAKAWPTESYSRWFWCGVGAFAKELDAILSTPAPSTQKPKP